MLEPIVFFIILLAVLSMAMGAFSLSPWVPIIMKDLKRLNKIVDLKPGENFYELGSGDGRVIINLARLNKKCNFYGIEIAWPIYIWSVIKRFFVIRKNTSFLLGDLYKKDLSDADVVYFFGRPGAIGERLKNKLINELKPEARVVSYVFNVPGWEHDLRDKPSEKSAPIYLYRISKQSK